MKKGFRMILAGLALFFVAGLSTSADTFAAVDDANRPYMGMDEDGNMYEVTPTDGLVETPEEEIELFSEVDKVVNFNTKSASQTTSYTEEHTGKKGYTNGAYGADAAYLGTVDGKVRFMMSGVVGLVAQNEVQIIPRSYAKSISHYQVTSGWLLHNISYDLNRTGYAGRLRVGKAPTYLREGVMYYSYDGHYFYTNYSVMIEDYLKETRRNAVNSMQPFFNYFQYLPLRSVTRYTGDQFNAQIERTLLNIGYSNKPSKMRKEGSSFVSSQNEYGVNALLIASIAANESYWGTSSIAVNKNNLFGWNAVDSAPGTSANQFRSAAACIKEYANIHMSQGYLNPKDWRYQGGFLGNKGSGMNWNYASDPYWGEKAANIAWNMDTALGGLDQYRYTIGAKDIIPTQHYSRYIRAAADSEAPIIYHSGNQAATTFIITNPEPFGIFYQIQSDGVLNWHKNGLGQGGRYVIGSMRGYIGSSFVTIVNQGDYYPRGVDEFEDVAKKSWYYNYVKYVYDQGLMSGLNANHFGVNDNLVRAQFVTTIYRAEGEPPVQYENCFPDVGYGWFYTEPAIWANKNKIMTGYANGKFGGSDPITREQMVTILFRYAKMKNYDTSKRAQLTSFPDHRRVQSFATEAMKWAVAEKLITGDGGKLNPQGTASRLHCAAMLTRFMQRYRP